MAEQTGTDTMEKGGLEDYSYGDGSIHPLNRPEPIPLKHGMSICLRLLTFGAILAAFIVMVTNEQTSSPFSSGVKIKADYHFLSAFVWFVIASAIVFVYSLVAIVAETCMVARNSNSSYLLWVIFGSDLTMMNILMSACAASLAVELLAQRGNSYARWGEFCRGYSSFCNHVTGALVAGAVGFAGLAELCILDAYHLSTQYTRY